MGFLSFSFSLLALLSFSCATEEVNTAAVSSSVINHIPGFAGPLPFYLETGYVGVGNSNQDQLFYYFVESENNPKEDPLLLWLTGGPGCSALSGLVYEIGPLSFKNLEFQGGVPPLELNLNSWTKVSSVIFVDQPIGTGFSYTKGRRDKQTGDLDSANESFEFLRKWLISHPQFLSNPLYIGGDSYAGKIVPIIAFEIANSFDDGREPHLNFQGYLLGNPRTNKRTDDSSKVPFAHGMGLISDELYESAKKNCEGVYVEPTNQECKNDLDAVEKLVSGLSAAYILMEHCPLVLPKLVQLVGDRRSLEQNPRHYLPPQPLPTYGCMTYLYLLSYFWANNDIVRNALGIRKGTVSEWIRCEKTIPYTKDVSSSIDYHINVTSRGYRALVYSGDHDLLVPFVGTQAWIRSLNFSIVDDWRPWLVYGQVAGFTRSYSNNLTFATVKGGDEHTAVTNLWPFYFLFNCFLFNWNALNNLFFKKLQKVVSVHKHILRPSIASIFVFVRLMSNFPLPLFVNDPPEH